MESLRHIGPSAIVIEHVVECVVGEGFDLLGIHVFCHGGGGFIDHVVDGGLCLVSNCLYLCKEFMGMIFEMFLALVAGYGKSNDFCF